MGNGDYGFGIEEEFFLADARTRGTPKRGVGAFHSAVRERLDRVERELLQSQVEISTPPSTSLVEAHAKLGELRAGLAAIGREHGILVFGAGTHPVARWLRQSPTQADRYERIMRELRMLGSRNVVCGLHVHVEVPDPASRVRPHEPPPALPAGVAGLVDFFAVLAGAADGSGRLSAVRLRRDAPHGIAGPVRRG